jgi:simple sugar transport system permease protein
MAVEAKVPATARGARPQWLENSLGQILALAIALVIALVAGALIIVAYGESPAAVYGAIIEFAVTDDGPGYVLSIATPLIFSALALAVCFKAGLFNIGVEGQYLFAMVPATFAALHLDFLPGLVHVPVILLAAMLGGMFWAGIAGVLKVTTGAHEVVTTIMLNGIAVSFLSWALNGPLKFTESGAGTNVDLRSDRFADTALIGDIGQYFGFRPSAHMSWLFVLAVIAAVLVWFLVKRMRLGYEARAVGSSPGSAKAGGIGIGTVQVKLFLISGALAGLVGMQQLLADKGYLPQNYQAQLGFTGIAVAFLGQNNAIGIIFAAILWGALSRGESALQIRTDVPREFVIILQGILILAVVIVYQIAKRRLARRQLQRAGAEEQELEDAAGPPAEVALADAEGDR